MPNRMSLYISYLKVLYACYVLTNMMYNDIDYLGYFDVSKAIGRGKIILIIMPMLMLTMILTMPTGMVIFN